jgi:hypothetical protein
MAELIRGKTGRVYGDMMGLFTIMKGLPLAYNKDHVGVFLLRHHAASRRIRIIQFNESEFLRAP